MSVLKAGSRILITGGCGFIGSKLAETLIEQDYQLTILDDLKSRIHGTNPDLQWLRDKHIVFLKEDICNQEIFNKFVKEAAAVIHLAAETGTAQSMYEIYHYSETNIMGTANLVDALVNENHSVQKVILASSRAVYGEGKYLCPSCGIVYPKTRDVLKVVSRFYEPICPLCGKELSPLATDEVSCPNPSSIYGMSKLAQENMIRIACGAKKIPYTILRFQNVYGAGQSLANPYTGILPVFISQIKQKKQLLLFEDGLETRDFVHVKDIVSSIILSLTREQADNETFNVGSGEARTILSVAKMMYQVLQQDENYKITHQYRQGDIRHNRADITRIKEKLNYSPKISFEQGLREFIYWAEKQRQTENHFDNSINILKGKGLCSG